MKFQFFIIPVHSIEQHQQDLNNFCASHRVANIEKEFVNDGANSFWAVSITYHSGTENQLSLKKAKIDYREVLNEKDFAVFAKLRLLRKKFAEEEGVPAYAIFTNEQLASMVRNRVQTRSALASIGGIGEARLNKYGEIFLSCLKEELGELLREKNQDRY
jgi:superfamily II DNA helicase RecQ